MKVARKPAALWGKNQSSPCLRGYVAACLLVAAAASWGCGDATPPPPEPPKTSPPDTTQKTSPPEKPQKTFPPSEPQQTSPSVAEKQQPAAPAPLCQALAEFNRGAALLEQYQYSAAAEALGKAVALAPEWTAARFNLGLAELNMYSATDSGERLEKAREAFEGVLAVEPGHLPARFCLGLYYQHLGKDQEASACFKTVYEADPQDAYAAYKYGETLVGLDRNEEGVAPLQRAVEIDPGFVSATYRLAMQYVRMGQREKAKPLLERFRELNAAELTGGSFVAGKAYGTAGKYYMALGADNLPVACPEAATRRIVFSPQTRPLGEAPGPDAAAAPKTAAWKWSGGTVGLPGIAAADVDADGDLDLILTAGDDRGATSVWLNDGKGNFLAGPPLAKAGVAPCVGDVDNDGDVDIWLGCAGPDALLLNDGKGHFEPSRSPEIVGADTLTPCARLADLDSDGDLDLLAMRLGRGSVPASGELKAAASSVYINRRDGTFADMAEKLGLLLAETPVASVVYDDFDNDRDIDLAIFPGDGSRPVLWVNDRVWQYHLLDAAATGLDAERVLSALSADCDRDGDRDLLVFTEKGIRLFVNRGGLRFEPDPRFEAGLGTLGGTGGQFADLDNDGDLDLLIADAHRRDGTRGPALLVNNSPHEGFVDAAALDPGNLLAAIRTDGDASCLVADFTGDGRCDVLLAAVGQTPVLIENATPGGHWIDLDLLGARTPDNKTRSNNSAIGARVEVRSGSIFQQFVVGGASGPVSATPLRIHAGLGENTKVDWLRILWPDALLQAELELAADQVLTVTELPRKTSSCPHLFAWDGSQYRFVADFGGVGGLGYLGAPGEYAPVDPTEYVPLPPLQPQDGHYVLQAVEPLEEVVYFDEAKLVAVDHPAGTEVYPNERMAVNGPPPELEVFCFRDTIDPVQAVDHRGVDVTEEVSRVDRRYAGATTLDRRFAGLAVDHFVELDFGDRLQNLPPESRLILCLHGWVEYGYSSTNFAASQAGMRAKAPSIEVLRDGGWVELFHEAGYPAGLQHCMTLEVTGKLLAGDRRIRISSNMEIYWDRIFLGVHREDAELAIREVGAQSVDLHFRGYPREYSPDGRQPNLYDYGNVDPTAPWKLMSGDYTRFGEVAELLAEADDCYVIMGPGEEVTLRFPAGSFGPIPPGRQRSWMLKTDSFCKDMDLGTAHGDTVGPLPFHAMSGYPYRPGEHYPENDRTRDYRRRFNTRRVGMP